MYQLKSNPYSTTGFRSRYINELEAGFFYENKNGDRFLVIGEKQKDINHYARRMFKLTDPFHFCDEYSKYELRLVPPGEEITFVQSEPIPF